MESSVVLKLAERYQHDDEVDGVRSELLLEVMPADFYAGVQGLSLNCLFC